jgi:hypothetical protein
MTSEGVGNTGESSFGETQAYFTAAFPFADGNAAYDLPFYRMAAFFIIRIAAAGDCPRSSRE